MKRDRFKLVAARCLVVSLVTSTCMHAAVSSSDNQGPYHRSSDFAPRAIARASLIQRVSRPDRFELRPDEFGSVVVDGSRDRIYAGGEAEDLLAIDRSTGNVVWEMAMKGELNGRPVIVDDQILLVGSDNGQLAAIDLDSRDRLWTFAGMGTLRAQPLVADGVVYIASSRNDVQALDLRSGAWRWQYKRELPKDFTIFGRGGVAFRRLNIDENDDEEEEGVEESGVIYAGFDDGRVVAIGAGSGESIWLANLSPTGVDKFVDVDSTPLVVEDSNELIVGAQATGVHSLSLIDGNPNWTLAIEGAGTPVLAGDGGYIVTSSREGLVAIDHLGKLRWRQKMDPGQLSTPIVVNNTVYVAHSEQGLSAFAVEDGEYLGRFDFADGFSGQPVLDPSQTHLYAISNLGYLYDFDLRIESSS